MGQLSLGIQPVMGHLDHVEDGADFPADCAVSAPLLCPDVVELGGECMRRLFMIWNRGYKTMCVIANDISEALPIAANAGHMRRAAGYRKFEDITDAALAGDRTDCGPAGSLGRALEKGVSGVAVLNDKGCWEINGAVVGDEPEG